MSEFVKEVLPFVLIGISFALFAVSYSKKHKDKESGNDWDFASMGPIFGVAIGIAIGTVNKSISAALGAGIGMFIGTVIEFFVSKNK